MSASRIFIAAALAALLLFACDTDGGGLAPSSSNGRVYSQADLATIDVQDCAGRSAGDSWAGYWNDEPLCVFCTPCNGIDNSLCVGDLTMWQSELCTAEECMAGLCEKRWGR